MENTNKYAKQISNFIYNKPEIVAVLLIKYGYPISTENKSLIDILTELNAYTFELLYNGNEAFALDLANEMTDKGYLNNDGATAVTGKGGNGVVGALTSLAGALIGAFTASSEGAKNRQLQGNIANATLTSQELIGLETTKINAETEKINNITSNAASYRSSLNVEGSKRLNNTWVYVLAIGVSFGIFYALSKIGKKS